LGQDRLYYLTFLIAGHGATEEELRCRCETVETVFARRGVVPRKLVLRQVEGLKGVLPLAKNAPHDFERNLTSGAAACCLPLSVSSGGHSSGVMLCVSLFTRAPVFLDRFAGEHVVSNQHLFISGEPGSGKSVSGRTLAFLEGYRGVRTAFVDPEGEYVYFTESLDGQVVTLRPGKFSGINPLDVSPEPEEDGTLRVNVLDKITDLQGLVGAVFRYHSGEGMNVRETALLEEAAREEYRERGITEDPTSLYQNGVKKAMPTLSDIQRRLAGKPGAERLADAMKPLLAGGTLGMFEGQTMIHLQDAPYICFNLRGPWAGTSPALSAFTPRCRGYGRCLPRRTGRPFRSASPWRKLGCSCGTPTPPSTLRPWPGGSGSTAARLLSPLSASRNSQAARKAGR